MTRHPPKSTLLPYPALSRSAVERERDRLGRQDTRPAVAEPDELVPVMVDALADDRADDRVEAGAVSAAGQDADARHGAEDRKSTRLNSSHANTSYAVFCLKK